MLRHGRSISHLLAAAVVVFAALAITARPASAAQTFTNETSISTSYSPGRASPYPSPINVQGMVGRITGVSVALRRVTHALPGNFDILLVAPDGETSIVLSDACGSPNGVKDHTWIFDQSAPAPAPHIDACAGSLYRPTDHNGTSDQWPDAPGGPHYADFNQFAGGNPNGTWKLYVYGDAYYAGKIASGWVLTIETAVPDLEVPGNPLFDGMANPYPATRTISGVDGVITDLDVSLAGVFHDRPVDLDVLLVGPRGQNVMLMSDACDQEIIGNRSWTWSDESGIHMSNTNFCGDTSFKPTNWGVTRYGEDDAIPNFPPVDGLYGTELATFDDTDPNGEWRLYVHDDRKDDKHGFIRQRFQLHMTTRPRANVGFAADAVAVTEGQSGQVTLTRSSGGKGLGAGYVKVTSTPGSATSGTDFEPVSTVAVFAAGEAQTTIPVRALTDSAREQSETLSLTLGPATGDAAVGTPATALVTINDPAPVTRPDQGGVLGDRIAPVIRALRVRGRVIRYTLSEPAAVTVRFQRVARKHGRRARFMAAGTLQRRGTAGVNRIAFRRRPGTYRVVVTATDAAGNRSTARSRTFRIVKARTR